MLMNLAANLTRYKNYLLVLLLILVLVFGIFLLILPTARNLRAVRSSRDLTAQEVRDFNGQLIEMRALQEKIQGLGATDLAKLRALFVDRPEIAYVANVIEKYATDSKWFLNSFALSDVVANDKQTGPLLDINIQAQMHGGGYRELKEFLRFMTLATPLVEVSSFTFEPKSASTSINLKVRSSAQSATGTFDSAVFNERRFKALLAPLSLPEVAPVGKTNPFAPPAEAAVE